MSMMFDPKPRLTHRYDGFPKKMSLTRECVESSGISDGKTWRCRFRNMSVLKGENLGVYDGVLLWSDKGDNHLAGAPPAFVVSLRGFGWLINPQEPWEIPAGKVNPGAPQYIWYPWQEGTVGGLNNSSMVWELSLSYAESDNGTLAIALGRPSVALGEYNILTNNLGLVLAPGFQVYVGSPPFPLSGIRDIEFTQHPALDPTGLILSNDTVTAPDQIVGLISVTGTDHGNANRQKDHVFTLVAGDGDTDNALFEITEDDDSHLRRLNFIDAPVAGTYSIRLQADDGMAPVEETFTITVNTP